MKLTGPGRVRRLIAAAVIALLAAGAAIAARLAPVISIPLEKLDYLFYDSLYRLRPMEDRTNGRVVIVTADERSLHDLALGGIGKTAYGWPWPREFWGRMAGYFNRCGAKAIAFDLLFPEPSAYNGTSGDDLLFAKLINRSKLPVIFATRIDPDGRPQDFAPPVSHPVFGAANVAKNVMYRSYEPTVGGFPSLASRTVAAVGGTPPQSRFLLYYYGPTEQSGRHTFRYLAASHVLAASLGQKNTGVDPSMFRDKIVLIGSTAIGTYDLKQSPLSAEYPGVEVQATAIENMLAGQSVHAILAPWQAATAFLAALTAAFGIAFPRQAVLKLLAASLTTAALLAAATLLFLGKRIEWLPLAAPLLALLLSVVGTFTWVYFIEDRQRRFVLKALGQYVSPTVAAEIARNEDSLRLSGERREMTVMFTDIQGFTDLSESLEDQKLTQLLNYYLDEMSSLVFATNGTLDKYIGDAIMSFWNAPLYQPEHAALACRSALAMENREREIQPRLRELGADGLLTRIGINSGPMVFGNMGSSQKFNYSVLGDSVNLGSRLEGANKLYGSRILVAKTTADQVKDQFVLRQLDVLRVKGKKKPMAVYELMADAPASPDLAVRVREYESAFADYQQQKWDEAEATLLGLLGQHPGDRPAASLLERVRDLRQHPPGPDWDGVYIAKGK